MCSNWPVPARQDAFEYSGDVAAKHRQVAMQVVGKLIAMNVAQMQAARDESVAMANKAAPGW